MARILDGFLGNLYVLVIRRSSLGSVDGFFCKRDLVGVVRDVSRSIDGGARYSNVLLELGSVSRGVNGGTRNTDVLSVGGGLDSSAVFAFDAVNGRVVRLVVAVDLNGRLSVA